MQKIKFYGNFKNLITVRFCSNTKFNTLIKLNDLRVDKPKFDKKNG